MSSARAYLVTGGPGFLGRAVVAELLGHGAQVAVPYRGSHSWDELRAALGRPSGLWGAPADLSDRASTEAFVAEAVRSFGHLDGVAAVAGAYTGSGPLEDAPPEEWRSMLDSNLETAWTTCRAALPHLLERGGSVVTVGARLALEGGSGSAAYAVSKAGVVALTRVLALENKERGVRFNCVIPGTIDTPSNRREMPTADFGNWTSPQAIARVIAFLLSPESAPATGGVIPVDAVQPGTPAG